MTATETRLTQALRAAAEAFLKTLDENPSPAENDSSNTDNVTHNPGLTAFDPLLDTPPFPPRPGAGASDREERLASLTYLGAVGRHFAEYGRGATSTEVSEYARKAGYKGGNAVNGWVSRPGSPRAIETIDGQRFLNQDGYNWIKGYAARIGIELTGEVKTVPTTGREEHAESPE